MGGKLDRAIAFAIKKHEGQVRKGTMIPYISHPLAVCTMVIQALGTEDEACAAVLHDVVEDCGGLPVLIEIREQFGTKVASIVNECSDSFEEDPAKKFSWRTRKEIYLEHLPTASPSALLVTSADKLHNLRSIIEDYQKIGDKLWERFAGKKEGTLWYYGELCKKLDQTFYGHRLITALVELKNLL